MTVNVGTMQLPVTEDADQVRTYLNGTHVSGGLWTALTRASNHDHSGGISGIQLTATSIPDGSITTAKLDPSVLGPYALVDGSKPFTGTVTMSADTLIRDTLRFGAKPAGVADATLSRTGPGALRADSNLGVGVAPAAWGGAYRVLQVGQQGVLWGEASGANIGVSQNSVNDGGGNRALVAGPSALVLVGGGQVQVHTAPSVAAGATQTFTQRATFAPTGTFSITPDVGQHAIRAVGVITVTDTAAADRGVYYRTSDAQRWYAGMSGGLSGDDWGMFRFNDAGTILGTPIRVSRATGTLALAPDAGVASLLWGDGAGKLSGAGTTPQVEGYPGGYLYLGGAALGVTPPADNATTLGWPDRRWVAVYAVNGAIQTSSAEMKEGITPLDPLACYEAAKAVKWYEFAYLPPAYTESEPPPEIAYDAADDNETKAEKKTRRDEAEAASKAAHLKMVAETAPARNQRGFVFPTGADAKDEAGGALPPVPDLFGLSDRESTTPQADLATLGCALQEVIRRLETLEGAAA